MVVVVLGLARFTCNDGTAGYRRNRRADHAVSAVALRRRGAAQYTKESVSLSDHVYIRDWYE